MLLQLLDGKAPEEELKAQYSKVTKSGFRLTLTSSNDLAKLTMLLNVHLARKMGADLRIDDTIDKQIGNPDELFGKWIARARLEIALQRSKSAPSDEGIDQLVEILKLLRQ
ncbi:MAG: hypothetical protein MUO91_03770 [candidate division Zixibacteria bacterium]|nr:hypothetical protein [candidate division Zixibacteria bacterium]